MQAFSNADGGDIVLTIAQRIVANRAYLSEIDGLIGDGDHGVAWPRVRACGRPAARRKGFVSGSLATLGDVLMSEIGGSMGPLHGVMFSGFAEALGDVAEIDAAAFERMLQKASPRCSRSATRGSATRLLIDAFAGVGGVFGGDHGGRDLPRRARRALRRGEHRTRQHDRPCRQDRPGEPAWRALARRPRPRGGVLRHHPVHVRRGGEGEAGGSAMKWAGRVRRRRDCTRLKR